MKFEYRRVKLADLTTTGKGTYGIAAPGVEKNDNLYTYLRITDINDDGTLNRSDMKSVANDDAVQYLLKPNDIVFARTGGSTGRNYFYDGNDGTFVYAGFLIKFSIDPLKVNPKYIKYYCQSDAYKNWVKSFNTGSTRGNINAQTFGNMEISLPPREQQDYLVSILEPLDEKIAINRAINDNLEQQLTALFIHDFADGIAAASTDTCPMLGDLITVIDNRGKTPPLTTEIFDYPIIDVGALKGSGRIVDFNNCTKYVEQATYETWFRSGHPKSWDILISTVGSLAEMKIYLGAKGCMAQNVVALRATSISPLYLYQYLRFIRADLVAYNIGSVQPSIKVTHIVKHPIFVPEFSKLQEFEATAMAITNHLYANYNECESLKELRDTLLPKLMSGEIDVFAVQP